MNPTLQGYTAAILEPLEAADLRRLAEDLAAVDHLLSTNRTLRSALTDVSVAAPPRRAVLADLLADRVSDPARRLAAFAAGSVAAPEVPSAVSWVAHRARQFADGQAPLDPSLGHAGARQRVGGFAAAVYEEQSADSLLEIEDELFRFARTVQGSAALRSALTDRDLPVELRQGVVDDLLADKVAPPSRRLVDYVVRGGRARDVLGTLDWLVEETARARGWRVARVEAASALDDEQRERLTSALSELAGRPVELQVTVDPRLLGGAVIEVGDLRVDATARGRLERLREQLLPSGGRPAARRRGDGAQHEGAG